MSAWTLEPLRAESCEVERTCHASDVFLGAEWTFGTKASIVLFAFPPLDGRVDVKVETVVAAVAESKCGVEPTFGDPSHVVLVQVVALVALLTQSSKPMLADGTLVGIA